MALESFTLKFGENIPHFLPVLHLTVHSVDSAWGKLESSCLEELECPFRHCYSLVLGYARCFEKEHRGVRDNCAPQGVAVTNVTVLGMAPLGFGFCLQASSDMCCCHLSKDCFPSPSFFNHRLNRLPGCVGLHSSFLSSQNLDDHSHLLQFFQLTHDFLRG